MLAGQPARFSPSLKVHDSAWSDGLIKLYLGHSRMGTVIVPSLLFCKESCWRFLQPSLFGPCMIVFNVGPGLHVARLTVDVGTPRANLLTRLTVELRSDERLKCYEDGAQLYRCRLQGAGKFASISSGVCHRLADGDFALKLFHHTNPRAFESIRVSEEFWSSAWNLQGTRKMTNVAHVYFTSLPRIERLEDLQRIAMSSDGVLRFQTTSTRPVEEAGELTVYRESTLGRTIAMKVSIPTAILAPSHLFFHPLTSQPAYYEVVGPEIYRVGLVPGAKLPVPRFRAEVRPDDLKRFDHVVVGDVSELSGVKAAYDEEDTEELMHLERLGEDIDLFEFWQANKNSDQVSCRTVNPRMLERSA